MLFHLETEEMSGRVCSSLKEKISEVLSVIPLYNTCSLVVARKLFLSDYSSRNVHMKVYSMSSSEVL